jgi:hypothetical protein
MRAIENTPEEIEAAHVAAGNFVAFAAMGSLRVEPGPSLNPLVGTRYTGKVRQQMRPDRNGETDNHGFPLSADNMARYGTTRSITGGDGIERTMVEVRGNYKGKNGTFEWIIEPDRTVNHRFFRVDR